MEYEWYADIFFLTNFLMDFAGIHTAAVCCNCRVRPGRAVLACAVCVCGDALGLFMIPGYLPYRLFVHIVLNPLMIYLAFRPRGAGQFLRLLLSVYVAFFFVGGVQESLCFQLGTGARGRILAAGIFAAAAFAVYMQRWKTLRYVCEVDLWLHGEKRKVRAYCDSGNLLCDPGNGHPVSILDRSVLRGWETDDLPVQRIPYHTISENQSYLDVVTLDEMDIYLGGTVRRIKAPEIGLHAGKIMQRPAVQMLLHASYMSG